MSAGGGAAGLLLGGVLTEYASWRWTLHVDAVLAALGILGALATLAHQERVRGQRTDVAGTASITTGLVGLVFGFSHAYENGWTDALTLVCLIGGALLIAAFLVIESRVADPILPLRVLAPRVRGASSPVLFVGSAGLVAETLLLTYYLQDDLGFSPFQAGLAFLPQTIAPSSRSAAPSGRLCSTPSPPRCWPAYLASRSAGGDDVLAEAAVRAYSDSSDIAAAVVVEP